MHLQSSYNGHSTEDLSGHNVKHMYASEKYCNSWDFSRISATTNAEDPQKKKKKSMILKYKEITVLEQAPWNAW